MSNEKVFPEIKKIVADVLVIDESDVEMNKRLVSDLGAESIDFLDLVFQLERTFDIKIPRGLLEKRARGAVPEGEFEKNGVVTAEGEKALREILSEVPSEYFPESIKVNEIPTLFTIETLCKWVVEAQQEKAGA